MPPLAHQTSDGMDRSRRKAIVGSEQNDDFSIPFLVDIKTPIEEHFDEDGDDDITLIFEHKRARTDRRLLSSKSEYFRALFNSPWAVEHRKQEITLHETPSRHFSIVLESFHTNCIRIPFSHSSYKDFDIIDVYELYHLYHRYLFVQPAEALVTRLDRLLDRFGWNGIWQLWNVVAQSEEDFFFKLCLDWISRNQDSWPEKKTPFSFKNFRSMSLKSLEIFLDYDANVHEFFTLIACIKWMSHNKISVKQSLSLLKKVRVSLLSWQSLKECDSFIPPPHLVHLRSEWKSQMLSLNNLDPALKVINKNWTCDIAKDVCYVPNPAIIKHRGFCLPDKDIIDGREVMIDYTPTPANSDSSSLLFDLQYPFWVNELQIKFSDDIDHKYRYLVECSVDGQAWRQLFDYREYLCSNKQMLIFRPVVMRFLRIHGQEQDSLRSETVRPISPTARLEAFYRPKHNFYSCGLRRGLYCSPYQIFIIKSALYSGRFDGNFTMIVQTEQPVHVDKFTVSIPEGYQISYIAEIYDAHTGKWNLVHNRARELCAGIQLISFTDRPVNLIRFVVTNIVAGSRQKMGDFRLKSVRFFSVDELKRSPLSEPRWESCWPLS